MDAAIDGLEPLAQVVIAPTGSRKVLGTEGGVDCFQFIRRKLDECFQFLVRLCGSGIKSRFLNV